VLQQKKIINLAEARSGVACHCVCCEADPAGIAPHHFILYRFERKYAIALRAGVVTCYIIYKSATSAASPLYKAKGAFFRSTS